MPRRGRVKAPVRTPGCAKKPAEAPGVSPIGGGSDAGYSKLASSEPFPSCLLVAFTMSLDFHEPDRTQPLGLSVPALKLLSRDSDAAAVVNSSDPAPAAGVESWPQPPPMLAIPEGAGRPEEVSLRRRELELRALVETLPYGLHWADAEGTILWANRAELDMLGYSEAEYVGRSSRDVFIEPQVFESIVDRLSRREAVRDQEARLRCRDGSVKTVLFDATGLWEDGRFLHSQCVMRDVTEQRRAEELVRHAAAIVEWSDDAIVSKNLDGIIRSWNRGAERIFGYSAQETIGRPITLLLPPERLEEETRILARLRRGERIDHLETVRVKKDGTRIDVSLTISPVKDATGRIVGASKIARDITDRKRSEAALEETRRQLARANEELEARVAERTASLREAIAQMEEFSYTVSHDLRAPLRGMLGYSQALLEDYGPSLKPEMRLWLKRIAENAQRLDKMVTDILTFSRIGRAELQVERVHLDRLVRDIVTQYPGMLPPRAFIEIEPLLDVRGHEPSLIQVVSNLLNNAVKFVRPGVRPVVRVWTETHGESVRLLVRDNGIGIRAEYRDRLFRMFERVHPDLEYEGNGVGLAIVRKAANRMGGEAGVESDGENGSTFWVQLPRAD
ncbi:hypothetical protein DB347_01800 [Opitutaceae bacterium EW11]|nr:hypothetical protein DB347_01800 [Opitutaceae bacterium EW11]